MNPEANRTMRHVSWLALRVMVALFACKSGAQKKETSPEPSEPGADRGSETVENEDRAASATKAAESSVATPKRSRSTGSVAVTLIEGRSGIEDTGFLHIIGE